MNVKINLNGVKSYSDKLNFYANSANLFIFCNLRF